MSETLNALNRMAHLALTYYEVTPSGWVFLVFGSGDESRVLRIRPAMNDAKFDPRQVEASSLAEAQAKTQAVLDDVRAFILSLSARLLVDEVPYSEWSGTPREVWNHTLNRYDTFGGYAQNTARPTFCSHTAVPWNGHHEESCYTRPPADPPFTAFQGQPSEGDAK